MLQSWLLAQRSRFNMCTQGRELLDEELAHAHDVWPARLIGRDGGNGNGLAQALDEVIGHRVDLLEEAIELRGHLAGLVGANGICEVGSGGWVMKWGQAGSQQELSVEL